MLKNGHLRAAGAVAGVSLEAHFAVVVSNHQLRTTKREAAIADFNELLKANDVIDVPQWRSIQRMADIRNYCVHNKQQEPTKDEVTELIDGVDRLIKTLH